jgi:hypothetical protein
MGSIIIGLLLFTAVVITIAGIWKTFAKAGQGGWKALIPIYNNYIMLRIGGHSGWWILTFFLPVLPWMIALLTSAASAQTPGATEGTASFATSAFQMNIGPEQIIGTGGVLAFLLAISIMLVVSAFFQLAMLVSVVMVYDVARSFGKSMAFTLGLMALPFVFWPILGFGDAEYRGPVTHPSMVDQNSDPSADQV